MKRMPAKTVERMCLYRQILLNLTNAGQEYVFSHELASIAMASAAQVRRDLMMLNSVGTPQKGYKIKAFLTEIEKLIDPEDVQKVALIGVGNLGRAILSYFIRRRPKIAIVAGFDNEAVKTNRMVAACPIHDISSLEDIVAKEGINLAMITVPADQAQNIANRLVAAGVKGIVNFAPIRLKVPDDVYLEDLDITLALEKTAYFAKINSKTN